VLALGPSLMGGERRFAAALGPADRPAQPVGQGDREDLVAVDVELGAEAAPHRRRHHPQLALGDSGGGRQHHPQHVRHLGRRVEGHVAAVWRRHGQHAAWLHRRGDQALLVEVGRHGVSGICERCLECVGVGNERPVEALVGRQVGVRGGLLRFGGLDGGHRRQRLVVDIDELGGVGRAVAVFGEHHRHHVSYVAGLVDRHRVVRRVDHVVGDRPSARKRCDPQAHVGQCCACVDGMHAGGGLRGRGVDAVDPGVGERAAHHAHPQLAGDLDVVDVGGFAGEELGVLLAQHPGSHGAHDAPPCEPPVSLPAAEPAAARTDLTMLW